MLREFYHHMNPFRYLSDKAKGLEPMKKVFLEEPVELPVTA
jgi:hypothetical protein